MFAIVTIVALLASPIILWLDPWVWGFPTIYFLVSANVAVVVYLYFTIFSYIFLLFSVVSWQLQDTPATADNTPAHMPQHTPAPMHGSVVPVRPVSRTMLSCSKHSSQPTCQ